MKVNRHRLVNAVISAVRSRVGFAFYATDIDMCSDGNVYVGSMLTFDAVNLEKVRLFDIMAGDCIGTLRMSEDGSDFHFSANTAVGLAPSELQNLKDLLFAAWENEMAIKKALEKDA